MKSRGSERHSNVGEALNIVAVNADEQRRRVHAAIARHAYEIFKNRGAGVHDREDWRQAESAVLQPFCVGRMSVDDSFWVSIDATHFQESTISIWVAPQRLTICGKPRVKSQPGTPAAGSAQMRPEMIFREVLLPIEVDPSRVTSKFNGQFLEIFLAKAQPKPELAAKAAAKWPTKTGNSQFDWKEAQR